MLAPQAEADRARRVLRPALREPRDVPGLRRARCARSRASTSSSTARARSTSRSTQEDEEEVERRFAWQTRAGLEVERLTAEEARALEPNVSPGVRVALRFPRDWQVENRRLVVALDAAAERSGARIIRAVEAHGVRVVAGARRGRRDFERRAERGRGRLRGGRVELASA